MKKIIIFGGYGFIGSHLYNKLKNKYIVLRFTSIKNKRSKINYNYKNFSNIIKNNKPDIIFFLSGTSYPDYRNKNHFVDLRKTNLVLQTLLSVLTKNDFKGKVFYFSSIGVYGSNKSNKVNEENLTKPESFYALAKVLAEKQCRYFIDNYGLKINILRICSIFGPNLKRQIIYKIIKENMNNNDTIKLLGSPADKREFLFIFDLVEIIDKLILSNAEQEILNIGSNKQYLIIDVIKKVQKITKKSKKIIFMSKIKTPKLPLLDNKKLYKFINLKKNFDLDKGLRKTILNNK